MGRESRIRTEMMGALSERIIRLDCWIERPTAQEGGVSWRKDLAKHPDRGRDERTSGLEHYRNDRWRR